METVKSLYYTVKQIKILEGCGKDKAYDIAKELPHEKRGKQIFVFAEDYERYYAKKREKALERQEHCETSNVYQIRKLN